MHTLLLEFMSIAKQTYSTIVLLLWYQLGIEISNLQRWKAPAAAKRTRRRAARRRWRVNAGRQYRKGDCALWEQHPWDSPSLQNKANGHYEHHGVLARLRLTRAQIKPRLRKLNLTKGGVKFFKPSGNCHFLLLPQTQQPNNLLYLSRRKCWLAA